MPTERPTYLWHHSTRPTDLSQPWLHLLFEEAGSELRLAAASIKRPSGEPKHLTRSDLGAWHQSLPSFSIAVLLARAHWLHDSRDPQRTLILGSTQKRRSWIWCLAQASHQKLSGVQHLFGSPRETKMFIHTHGGTGDSASVPEGILPSPAELWLHGSCIPLNRIRIFLGNPADQPSWKELCEFSQIREVGERIWNHEDKWKNSERIPWPSFVEKPAMPGFPRMAEEAISLRVELLRLELRTHIVSPVRGPIKSGDHLQVHIAAEEPVHFYCAWVDQDNKVMWIHPGSPLAQGAENVPEPTTSLQLPREDTNAGELTVEGKRGLETLVVMAAKQPVSKACLVHLSENLKTDLPTTVPIWITEPLVNHYPRKSRLVVDPGAVRSVRPSFTLGKVQAAHDRLGRSLAHAFQGVCIVTLLNLGPG